MTDTALSEHDEFSRLDRLVARVGRRVRIQRGLERATTAAAVSVMVGMVALVLWKTGWVGGNGLWDVALALGALPVLAFGSAWLGRLDSVTLAQRIDRSHNLHDRLSTAVAFATGHAAGETLSEEFSEAQLRDAIEHAHTVDVSRAAPFSLPRDLTVLALFAAGLGLLGIVAPPDHTHSLPDPPKIEHDPVLDSATIAMEKEQVEQMREELEGTDDPEAEQLVDDIDKLLEDVEDRKISGKEFLDRVEELEKRHFENKKEQAQESLAEKLDKAAEELKKEAGEELKDQKELKETVDALDEQDMSKAAKKMEELAEKVADDDEMDAEKLEKMADLMEKLGEKMNMDPENLEELYKKHKKLADKLAEKFDKQGNLSKSEKQKLEKHRKKAEEMKEKMDGEGKSDQQRRLEQLRRKTEESAEKMKKAAEQKKKGDQDGQKDGQKEQEDYRKKSGRDMKKASEDMEEEAKKQRSEQVKKKAQKQLEELKRSMRRSRPNQGKGKKGGKKSGQKGDGGKGERMREFIRRAQGEDGKKGSKKGQGKGKKGQKGGKKGGKPGQKPGQGDGEGGEKRANNNSNQKSNSAGDSPGGDPKGEKTQIDAERKDEDLSTGRRGSGPSKSKVIRSASEKGFATRDYKKVYSDYSKVVEEVMEREDVPPGYRYYVKRYFELIKPRQQGN